MMRIRKKPQWGISLLEVLLSISIIAIILMMATRYYFVASNNDKVNTTVSQVGALIAATHNWKGTDPTYKGLDEISLAEAGQLTNFPGYKNGELKTMWGDDIKVADNASENSRRVSITVNIPNDDICNSLQKVYPSDSSGNIESSCANKKFIYIFP